MPDHYGPLMPFLPSARISGKDLLEYSLDTVKGFARDVQALGFHILPEE